MATVSGLWQFNENIYNNIIDFEETVNFTISTHDKNYIGIRGVKNSRTISVIFLGDDNQSYLENIYYSTSHWVNNVPPTLDFGETPQTVSETFYNWLEASATKLTNPFALYNGVRLPIIPQPVLANYPYAWIRNNINSGYYDLILSKTARYFSSAGIYPNDSSVWYRIEIANADSATMWELNKISEGYYSIDNARTVLWSNHDIPNGSATATDIYFKGTEPVPIEEEPEEPTKTVITYNNETIATLEAGQTATIKAAEYEFEHDLVFKAGSGETVEEWDGTVVIE